jgi:hypothetical protein
MFARFCGSDNVFTMQLGLGADAYCVDVVALEQFVEIGNVFNAKLLGGGFAASFVGIPHTGEIDIGMFFCCIANTPGMTEPEAELGESDFFGHRISLGDFWRMIVL